MRSAFERSAVSLGAVLVATIALVGWPRSALAEGVVEPTYGRIDGDLSLVVGIGGVIAVRGPRAGAEVRVRYLESAGLFATYEDGQLVGSSAEPSRVLATGFELRPVFLLRWLEGLESRHARLDLLLDSLGIEIGTTFAESAKSSFSSSLSSPGLEVGLGVEIPIETTASGLWIGIHGGLRWGPDALSFDTVRDADDRAAFLAITFAWHQIVAAHLVDAGDRAPR